ncbi:MAG: hypothetical protein NWF05_11855 [Candidatus Bathyarchaeota archaeon]|nr:hypothetical protein [Candidatus Bathyarchaeota archaeon]
MTGKKNQPKEFKPLEVAVNDSIETGFFGDKYFKIGKLIAICKQRGLSGMWSQQDLSNPLTLFVGASKDEEVEKIDAALAEFADAIGFDANLVKRHYYAIKQGWEEQFLKAEQAAEIAFGIPSEDSEETEESSDTTEGEQPKEKAKLKENATASKGKQQER